jgi:hypothetical protein
LADQGYKRGTVNKQALFRALKTPPSVSAASGDRLQERISITHGQRARSTTAASWASVSAIGGMRRIHGGLPAYPGT